MATKTNYNNGNLDIALFVITLSNQHTTRNIGADQTWLRRRLISTLVVLHARNLIFFSRHVITYDWMEP